MSESSPQGEWEVMPTTLIDELVRTIPQGTQRRRYKRLRNKALTQWAPAGLNLQVVPGTPQPRSSKDVYGLQPGQILLHRGTSGTSTSGGYALRNSASPTSAIMGLVYGLGRGATRRNFVHELGHILGLGHSDAADSVMNSAPTTWHPSAMDLAGVIGPDVGLPEPGDAGYPTMAAPKLAVPVTQQRRRAKSRAALQSMMGRR